MYESILRFVQRFQPDRRHAGEVVHAAGPIFDAFNITTELEKALRPKVWLKSGGYIVINQTEALVAIDVNTGKYVGKSNRLEDTIVKTNTEAVKEIVRQVRLRDLGGIIVIDFIDMDERKNRQKVMQTLEEAMRTDRAPYKILQFNDFGLVAITRKRVKQSLERTLACPARTAKARDTSRACRPSSARSYRRPTRSRAPSRGTPRGARPDVAKVLKSNQNKYLEELEEVLKGRSGNQRRRAASREIRPCVAGWHGPACGDVPDAGGFAPQTVAVYSEFTRIDPLGNPVRADRGAHPHAKSFHPPFPVTRPTPVFTWWWKDGQDQTYPFQVIQNPDGAVGITVL